MNKIIDHSYSYTLIKNSNNNINKNNDNNAFTVKTSLCPPHLSKTPNLFDEI